MNILIFEYHNFGIEDVKECFEKNGHKYKIKETVLYREDVSDEFDELFNAEFDKGCNGEKYDCVFTFNYSPVISNNCNRRNIPYIAFIYDNPQVLLYSYTIINKCNYVFIFDKLQYQEFKNAGINTVYYAPLAVNTDRLKRITSNVDERDKNVLQCDISFVGSLYDEKHNFFDRLEGISDYTRGYIDAVIKAQSNIYGCFFLEELLTDNILDDMQKACPVKPSATGVETVRYLYANYFLARKLASDDRKETLEMLGKELGNQYEINLYTNCSKRYIQGVNVKGPVDYYECMPIVFNNSNINLNITLRSIKSGIPLRAMDICGSGGFLLSNYQADFYDVFVPGEDVVLYDSLDEMIKKCRYYLGHEKERQQIADNGYGKIVSGHTYDIRFKEIFDVVFNKDRGLYL